MQDDRKYTAPALEKGLDIIDVLSSQDHGLSQTEIARTLNRSVSEIYRMLVVLRRRGLVELDPAGDRYYLTTKLFEMANRTPIIARLTVAAGPIMASLAQATDESVHLTVLSDDSILVIGQVDNPGYNVMRVKLGARIEAWRTRPAGCSSPTCRRRSSTSSSRPIRIPTACRQRGCGGSSKASARGYEQMPSYVVKGVTNISAAVMGHDGAAAAAMTIPYVDRHFGSVPIDLCRTMLMEAASTCRARSAAPSICRRPPRRADGYCGRR